MPTEEQHLRKLQKQFDATGNRKSFWRTLKQLIHRPLLYLERRKKAEDLRLFKGGFDFAAGALLRGDLSAQMLDQFVVQSSCFDKRVDPFDDGCLCALQRLLQLGAIEDNRPPSEFRAPCSRSWNYPIAPALQNYYASKENNNG